MEKKELTKLVESCLNDSIHKIVQKYGDISRNDSQIAEELHTMNMRLDATDSKLLILIEGDSMNKGIGVRIQKLEEQNIDDDKRLTALESKQHNKDIRSGGIAASVGGVLYIVIELIQNNLPS